MLVHTGHLTWLLLHIPDTILLPLQGVLRKSRLLKSQSQRFTILDTMNAVLHPGRFTLLLGPPGAGKSSLLKALAGRFHNSSNVDVSPATSLQTCHVAVMTQQAACSCSEKD